MEFTVEKRPATNRFTADIESHTAYIEYLLTDNVLNITHTIVPKALEGRGVAGVMTKQVLELARQNQWKIIPSCSYTRAYIQKHPEFQDLLQA